MISDQAKVFESPNSLSNKKSINSLRTFSSSGDRATNSKLYDVRRNGNFEVRN